MPNFDLTALNEARCNYSRKISIVNITVKAVSQSRTQLYGMNLEGPNEYLFIYIYIFFFLPPGHIATLFFRCGRCIWNPAPGCMRYPYIIIAISL